MFHKFLKYISQSISGMIGVSVYILADTFFISYKCGADGLAALNLILPVFGLVFAIGSMIGIGSATRYNISTAQGSPSDYYFTPVHLLVSHMQHSFYAHRNLHSA